MKYSPGVPMLAPNGLRTHICQAPRKEAARNAANATQQCARQSLSTLRTGYSPVLARLEGALRHHLNGSPHVAMAEAAIFVTGHEQVFGASERRVHLGDEAGHHHGVHIGPGDQETMDDVRRREAQGDASSIRYGDATGNEHELRSDDAHGDGAVRPHRRPEILFGELARQVRSEEHTSELQS